MPSLTTFIGTHCRAFPLQNETTVPKRHCVACDPSHTQPIVDSVDHKLWAVNIHPCHEYIGADCLMVMIKGGNNHCPRCGVQWFVLETEEKKKLGRIDWQRAWEEKIGPSDKI